MQDYRGLLVTAVTSVVNWWLRSHHDSGARFAGARLLPAMLLRVPSRWRTALSLVLFGCLAYGAGPEPNAWQLNGFVRPPNAQPIIAPKRDSVFVERRGSSPVRWEALHTFNPAAIVRRGKIYVLYRAEDDSGENR